MAVNASLSKANIYTGLEVDESKEPWQIKGELINSTVQYKSYFILIQFQRYLQRYTDKLDRQGRQRKRGGVLFI